MAKRAAQKVMRGGAIMFPDRRALDGGMAVHYGQKSMENWAGVEFGPLARHITGDVAAAYGEVQPEVWVEMVLEDLANKLDALGGIE